MSARSNAVKEEIDVVQEFTRCMTTDDIDGIVGLFAEDSEWVIMATGETPRGQDKIRELAARSVAARNHTGERGIHRSTYSRMQMGPGCAGSESTLR
jgi:ketosteroid isomerase-like protein